MIKLIAPNKPSVGSMSMLNIDRTITKNVNTLKLDFPGKAKTEAKDNTKNAHIMPEVCGSISVQKK